MHDHLQGKKHAKTIKFGPRQTIPCHVCELDFTYPVQLFDHINGPKHKERAFYLLGFPMLMCHLCNKIVTGNRDDHLAGQRHTSNLAHAGAQAEELPWVRVSRYLTNPTAEQEAQIHRSDMEDTFRGLHHVFGDLWTHDMTNGYSAAGVDVESFVEEFGEVENFPFPVGVADTAPVASTSLADLPDEEVFYYDIEGDEVPHAVLVSAGLIRR